jgi:hypothetical protein
MTDQDPIERQLQKRLKWIDENKRFGCATAAEDLARECAVLRRLIAAWVEFEYEYGPEPDLKKLRAAAEGKEVS